MAKRYEIRHKTLTNLVEIVEAAKMHFSGKLKLTRTRGNLSNPYLTHDSFEPTSSKCILYRAIHYTARAVS